MTFSSKQVISFAGVLTAIVAIGVNAEKIGSCAYDTLLKERIDKQITVAIKPLKNDSEETRQNVKLLIEMFKIANADNPDIYKEANRRVNNIGRFEE